MANSPNNTWRWFYKYLVGSDVHTLMLRSSDGSFATKAATLFDQFMTALGPALYLASFVDYSYSQAGSNVRLPGTQSVIKATYGAGAPTGQQSVYGLAFPGRSLLGAKARVYPIGVKLQGDNNYRYTASENADVNAAIQVLRNAPAGLAIGIDGAAVNWYGYATSKQNDHFVKNRRGG